MQDARGYIPYQMSSGIQRIQRALSRADGHDLACDKSRMVYGDEGTGREDASKRTGGETPRGGDRDPATLRPELDHRGEPAVPSRGIQNLSPARPLPGRERAWTARYPARGAGSGIFLMGRKSVYEGNMHYGKAHGYGTLNHSNGKRYEGEWRNGCYKAGNRTVALGPTREECGF